MKTIYKTSILVLLVLVTLSSCSKKATPTPAASAGISLLAGNWETTQWGGISGDILIFTVDKTTAQGTVDGISGQTFGFSTGTIIFSDIKANTDGTFSCSGAYTQLVTGAMATRSATMSLQNNNTQLTVNYPAINSSYPAITYVYQQTSVSSVVSL
jgi:hypothetical protein